VIGQGPAPFIRIVIGRPASLPPTTGVQSSPLGEADVNGLVRKPERTSTQFFYNLTQFRPDE